MKRIALTLLAVTALPSCLSARQAPLPAETQIALAVQAAPEDRREDATVQGTLPNGDFAVLRAGTNDLVCMAPNPAAEQFEVSCHSASLEPFFERGRELRAQGIDGIERVQARYREFEAGSLPIPTGTTNYILTGSGFDPATSEIQDPYLRWVVYLPNATPETTGLSVRARANAPWLMFPGTPGAHIMITPPRAGGG